jgi:hypothetical protein
VFYLISIILANDVHGKDVLDGVLAPQIQMHLIFFYDPMHEENEQQL